MSYYPTFAFFQDKVTLREIACLLLSNLDKKIEEIGFQILTESRKELVSTTHIIEAISSLNSCESISNFWIQDDLNYTLFELSDREYLEIAFWEFDGDLYNSNSITQLMQNQKRSFAISLHETLLKHCGSKLSFTSSLDHKRYEHEFTGDFDLVNFVVDSFNQEHFEQVLNLPQTTSWIWLLGIQKDILPTGVLNEEVMQDFREVKNDETILILDSITNQPIFMNEKYIYG